MTEKKCDWKRIIWTACAFGLMIVGEMRAVSYRWAWLLAINIIGILVFPMISMRFDYKDFFRPVYYIWTGLCLIMAYPLYLFIMSLDRFDKLAATDMIAVLDVFLYGLIAVRMFFYFFDKNEQKKKKRPTLFAYVWVAMMAFSIVSVNQTFWPFWFLIMFGSFYFAPITEDDKERLVISLVDGILLGFFVLQGYAFLRRPFDELRYNAMTDNCNVAGMFYVLCYVAWLVRLSYIRKKEGRKAAYWIAFFISAAMWSFVCLTISRSAIVAFLIISVIYWIAEEIFVYRNRLKGFLKMGILMFALFVVSFLPVYCCVRYIPGLVGHPKYFPYQGYSKTEMVQPNDPIDSDKYTSLSEFFDGFFGRFDYEEWSEYQAEQEIDTDNEGQIAFTLKADGERALAYIDRVTPGTDEYHPGYVRTHYGTIGNIIGIRKYIYKYFLEETRFFGTPERYPNRWITKDFQAFHAHNGYIQYFYCFGIIPGTLFLFVSIAVPAWIFAGYKKKKEKLPWYYMLPMLGQTAFFLCSLTECPTIVGHYMFILYFVCLLPVMTKDDGGLYVKKN